MSLTAENMNSTAKKTDGLHGSSLDNSDDGGAILSSYGDHDSSLSPSLIQFDFQPDYDDYSVSSTDAVFTTLEKNSIQVCDPEGENQNVGNKTADSPLTHDIDDPIVGDRFYKSTVEPVSDSAQSYEPCSSEEKKTKKKELLLVTSNEEWELAYEVIMKHLKEFKVLGFDCEWVKQNPVSMLQLATKSGVCVLVRLHLLETVPDTLKKLLEDASILKVGVACLDDANKLLRDRDLTCVGCVDLRHVAELSSPKFKSTPLGLKTLAKEVLRVDLRKDSSIRCSNWENTNLSDDQITYAAYDAEVAVDILLALINMNMTKSCKNPDQDAMLMETVLSVCRGLMDVKYSAKASTAKREGGKKVCAPSNAKPESASSPDVGRNCVVCGEGELPLKKKDLIPMKYCSDGQKMSKRKKNYPDPMDIVHKYGADAIRLYLVNSPVVRADNLRFKEEGVRDISKDVFLPWFNAHRFLMQNVERLEREESTKFLYNESSAARAENYMDKWIVSFTQSLVKFVRQEMQAYRLYTVVPRLLKFVDQLTNWYVRMNRRRLKGETGLSDCRQSLTTLFAVIFTMTKVMATVFLRCHTDHSSPSVPETPPFLTEHMYQKNLQHLIDPETTNGEDTKSVHYLMLPVPNDDLIDNVIEAAVSRMQTVVELGRVVRDRRTLPMKYPLKEIVVIHKDPVVLQDILSLQNYIQEELNVRTVTVTSDKHKYGVMLRAEPDHKVLGARLKGAFKSVLAAIKDLTDDQLMVFQQQGSIEVAGHQLGVEDLRLIYTFDKASEDTPNHYEAHSDNSVLVLLDINPGDSMLDEGLAREVINRVQKLRKKAKLMPSDEITIFYRAGATLSRVIPEYQDFIFATIKQPMKVFLTSPPSGSDIEIIATDDAKIKDDELQLVIVRGHVNAESAFPSGASSSAAQSSPFCRFVNVELLNSTADSGSRATVLLENPLGKYIISLRELLNQVVVIFGLNGRKLRLYKSKDKKKEVADIVGNDVLSLHSTTLYAAVDS